MSNPPLTLTQFARLGGYARAASLTPAQRVASARKAARARWKKVRATHPQTGR